MVTVKESVLTDKNEIQERIDQFVIYMNQCLAENRREKELDKDSHESNKNKQ